MSIAISGSLAYDRIMDFPGRFKEHIMPENIHILSVSFVVNRLQKSLGGCAGNIAHTMKLLGGDPIVLGALGSDGREYLEHFRSRKIATKYIGRDLERLTASAHIITDRDDNQIAGFFPGTLPRHTPSAKRIKERVALAIVAPADKEVMKRHVREFAARGVPVVFDPGQQIIRFTGKELRQAIGASRVVFGNDYEMKMLVEKTGWEHRIIGSSRVLVMTMGARGSVIRTAEGSTIKVKPCKAKKVVDPTGAGDAYRGAFLVGLESGKDLRTCGQMGSVAASYAIETSGTQTHTFTKAAFWARYKKNYR